MILKKGFALFIATLVILYTSGCSQSTLEDDKIQQVLDGDTIELDSGTKLRLVQIDTPELTTNECYAQESKQALIDLIAKYSPSVDSEKVGLKTLRGKKKLVFEYDEKLDKVDKYERELIYLIISGKNLNIEMVRLGFATPYFYQTVKGKYAQDFLEAAELAKEEGLGIWKNCPGFIYDPNDEVNTGFGAGFSSGSSDDDDNLIIIGSKRDGNCSPDYRECVPPYPPDYDCSQLRGLGVIHVIGADPHRLDRDGDGVACESNSR